MKAPVQKPKPLRFSLKRVRMRELVKTTVSSVYDLRGKPYSQEHATYIAVLREQAGMHWPAFPARHQILRPRTVLAVRINCRCSFTAVYFAAAKCDDGFCDVTGIRRNVPLMLSAPPHRATKAACQRIVPDASRPE